MCIFCSIINGEIPSSKVYEDDKILAILDISQATKGHTLVMPKKHYANITEMPEDEYCYLMANARRIATEIIPKLNADGFNLLVNTNEAAGQTVMHTHVHIIPRYKDKDNIEFNFKENKYDLNEVLNQIK